MSARAGHAGAWQINGQFFIAAMLGSAAWYFWPETYGFYECLFPYMFAAGAVLAGFDALKKLYRDARLQSAVRKSRTPTDSHGSAREATWKEIVARGMSLPGSGTFLGLYRNLYPVFAPQDAPFSLTEITSGGGKSIKLVVANIFQSAMRGESVAVADIKRELAMMCVPQLLKLGHEVWCIDPLGTQSSDLPIVEINPYQAVIDAVCADDEFRKDAVSIARDLAILTLPSDKGNEKNSFFVGGAQKLLTFGPVYFAYTDPAKCTPANCHDLLNDPQNLEKTLRFVRDHLTGMRKDDPVVRYLKSEASSLLGLMKNNAEQFGSFVEWATQALAPYHQAGRLAQYGETAFFNIADLRERQIIIFIMTPLSHAREFASFTSMLNNNLMAAAKRYPNGRRIRLIVDEFLNFKFADIASDLETMRGLKMTADFYIQSFSGLVRKYGKETAAAINDYCDLKIYAGLNSYERAKAVSDMLSDMTVRSQDYSHKLHPDDLNVSSKEHARRLMTPDETLAMSKDEAWVFVKGLRPMRLKLIHYGEVSPWRNGWIADNPLEGPPLKAPARFGIEYGETSDA